MGIWDMDVVDAMVEPGSGFGSDMPVTPVFQQHLKAVEGHRFIKQMTTIVKSRDSEKHRPTAALTAGVWSTEMGDVLCSSEKTKKPHGVMAKANKQFRGVQHRALHCQQQKQRRNNSAGLLLLLLFLFQVCLTSLSNLMRNILFISWYKYFIILFFQFDHSVVEKVIVWHFFSCCLPVSQYKR